MMIPFDRTRITTNWFNAVSSESLAHPFTVVHFLHHLVLRPSQRNLCTWQVTYPAQPQYPLPHFWWYRLVWQVYVCTASRKEKEEFKEREPGSPLDLFLFFIVSSRIRQGILNMACTLPYLAILLSITSHFLTVNGQLYPHGGNPDNFPVFKILIAVPIEKATIFSRDLQEAIGWWEGIHRNIGRPNWNNVYAPSGEEIHPGSLQFSQIHVGNDTLRLFHSICDAVEKDSPSIILSLIDAKKTDYMRMIAESADVPLVTLSHDYMKEPQNVIRRITPNRQVS